VFRLFDNMMLLGEGEMLYHGSPDLGLEYFKRLNFECEPFNNPADFFMDVRTHDVSWQHDARMNLMHAQII
jgi:ATP-binding cassette subfamily G (WHITE) protein 2